MKSQLLRALLGAYAQRVLGCGVFPLEQEERPFLKSPLATRSSSGPNQFAGRTTLNSGSATVTVSTLQVNSDSLIFMTGQHFTTQASGFAAALCVRTISPNNFFTVGWSDALGRAFDTQVLWEMRRTS